MKLTAKQHRNIANGIERIKSACLYGYWSWETRFLSGRCHNITGTYFSDRFKK